MLAHIFMRTGKYPAEIERLPCGVKAFVKAAAVADMNREANKAPVFIQTAAAKAVKAQNEQR